MSLSQGPSTRQAGLYLAQPLRNEDGTPRMRKLLVANRGEIACRIIDTCKKLSIATIAIFVSEDASSRHVTLADHALCLGPVDQEGGSPYLNAHKLVDICVKAGADALHPGYGYLSENADFADQVRKAGITFVGPSAAAMSTLGDKRSAKAYLHEHDSQIPLIPGFTGSSQDSAELERAAAVIGFPIMLKASAGGGGKGMRIVRHPRDLAEELKSAQSEAVRSFGSSDCILEKYIEVGKHIEIQIIGDSRGNVVSLHERECSVQRRHQKVIEESPSPWITAEKRKAMSDAAIRIGKLLKYENAGTVEFVVDAVSGRFYFLEVNTRLQVEHPITEEVCGVDIVALQLLVATGGSLADIPALHPVPRRGHAIECRLCAEDPNRGFYPERGLIHLWRPADAATLGVSNLRVETAVQTGGEVSIHFDSMIAKMIVWAPTRQRAIDEMTRVLANTACIGVRTNQQFLQSCLLHPEFQNPSYTTSFIPDNIEKLLLNPYLDSSLRISQALSIIPCLWIRNGTKTVTGQPFQYVRKGFRNQHLDPVNTPLDIVTSRLSKPLVCHWLKLRWHAKISPCEVRVFPVPTESVDEENNDEAASVSSRIAATYNDLSRRLHHTDPAISGDSEQSFDLQLKDSTARSSEVVLRDFWIHEDIAATVDGLRLCATVVAHPRQLTRRSSAQMAEAVQVMCHFPALGDWVDFKIHSPLTFHESLRQNVAAVSGLAVKQLIAPMPCKVVTVQKKTGETVKEGDLVIVVESMKMEINMSISAAGKIKMYVEPGQAIEEGTLLGEVE